MKGVFWEGENERGMEGWKDGRVRWEGEGEGDNEVVVEAGVGVPLLCWSWLTSWFEVKDKNVENVASGRIFWKGKSPTLPGPTLPSPQVQRARWFTQWFMALSFVVDWKTFELAFEPEFSTLITWHK